MSQQDDSLRRLIVEDILSAIRSIDPTEGYAVTDVQPIQNNVLDFDEGSGEISFSLERGVYSGAELASAVQSGLNNAGSLNYSVSYDSSRRFQIAADGDFSLLASSGSHSLESLLKLLGFSTDQTGNSSYTGSVTNGYFNTLGESGLELKSYNECHRYPAVFVTSSSAEVVSGYHGQSEVETVRMQVIVDGYVKGHKDKEIRLNRLYSDIVRAVLKDPSRSEMANYTKLSRVETDAGIIEDYGLLAVVFEVEYDFDVFYP